MEAFLLSTGLVALAEMGDKTQLLSLLLAARWLLTLTKDLLKVPHLGEVHVALNPPRLSGRVQVFSPPVVCQQFVRLGIQLL